MLFLNRWEVEQVLDVDQLVEALTPAMIELSDGSASVPPRVGASVSENGGILGAMPAYLRKSNVLGAKLVSIFPSNTDFDLPTHFAVVIMFDPITGAPVAIMDGNYITGARTAAGSALATKVLARENSEVLAVIGSGVQGKAHLQAIPRFRPIREIRLAGRNRANVQGLVDGLPAEVKNMTVICSSYQEAIKGADVICATTHSSEPVVYWDWLKPGAHVNSVGLNHDGQEVDPEIVKNSLLVVESRKSALAPAPAGANEITSLIRDGSIDKNHVHAEIGEILGGKFVGRTTDKEVTLYKSVGVAVQDAIAGNLALVGARAAGIGTEIDF